MHSEGNPSGPFVLGLLGLKLKRRTARFALNAECGEGFLRPVECAGKKTYGGPYDVRSSVNWPLVEGGAWGDVQKTEFSAAKD